ncbi:MAG: PadR family transcriptional regulator [Cellulosilyticaceae bacterium]
MIKAFILYYLSLKPTHGYEIQKFIQLNHMDEWTKIQPGSIYYAINKLEKEGLIVLVREEYIGAKSRKIFTITEKGRVELDELLKEELDQEIYQIGSDKFTIYPVLNSLSKEIIKAHTEAHLTQLQTKQKEIKKWQKIKMNEASLKVDQIYFEMVISNLDYQIQWHEALLEELDACKAYSEQISTIIQTVDFSTIKDMKAFYEQQQQPSINELKEQVLHATEDKEQLLEALIERIKGEQNGNRK